MDAAFKKGTTFLPANPDQIQKKISFVSSGLLLRLSAAPKKNAFSRGLPALGDLGEEIPPNFFSSLNSSPCP
jgi:hypothetical protein